MPGALNSNVLFGNTVDIYNNSLNIVVLQNRNNKFMLLNVTVKTFLRLFTKLFFNFRKT